MTRALSLVIVVAVTWIGVGCETLDTGPPLGSCMTTEQCPPDQVCAAGTCIQLEEGRVIGNFECIRDNPAPDTGIANVVAKINGKDYSLATSASCVTTASPTSPGDTLFFSVTISGINHGELKADWLTLFLDEATGFPGEPRPLEPPGQSTSKSNTGYLSVDDPAHSTTVSRRAVGWISEGSLTIDVWPPASGATLKGQVDARLIPATAGRALSAACSTVVDCGDDLTARCDNLTKGAPFCWTECDKDETACGTTGACVGYTTPLGTPRKACVAACPAGTCQNRALVCHAGTNGTKGCFN
jgi:hypothetical protein